MEAIPYTEELSIVNVTYLSTTVSHNIRRAYSHYKNKLKNTNLISLQKKNVVFFYLLKYSYMNFEAPDVIYTN